MPLLCILHCFAKCLRWKGREKNLLETEVQWLGTGRWIPSLSRSRVPRGWWGRLEGKHKQGSRKQDDTSLWICPRRVGYQIGGVGQL